MRVADQNIERFPDPVPYTDEEGVERFKEGIDEEEKFLTSKLADITKQHHGFSFSPTTQHAKTVCKYIKCAECKKPRVIYAEKKLKPDEQVKLKKTNEEQYMFVALVFRTWLKNLWRSFAKIFPVPLGWRRPTTEWISRIYVSNVDQTGNYTRKIHSTSLSVKVVQTKGLNVITNGKRR